MRTSIGLEPVTTLEHAIAYTSEALAYVDAGQLARPTPCAEWSLHDLLLHMDDALAAFTEAAVGSDVDLRPTVTRSEAARLVESLRVRACATVAAWREQIEDRPVTVGAGSIEPARLAGVGALEIAVHGWDVAAACGVDHPLPAELAAHLLEVAADVVTPADRGRRFAPPRPTAVDADPSARLLAYLGR